MKEFKLYVMETFNMLHPNAYPLIDNNYRYFD